MTPTAVKNKEIRSREDIAKRDRRSKEDIETANREQRWREHQQNLGAKYYGDTVGALAKGVSGVGSIAKAINDSSWYTNTAEGVKPVFDLPQWQPPGTAVPTGPGPTQVPDYIGFPFVNRFGGANQSSINPAGPSMADFMNLTAERMRAYIAAKTGRAANYDPSDIMFINIGSTDIIARMLQVRKCITFLNFTDVNRRLIAYKLLCAHGYDYEVEFPQKANLVTAYNAVVNTINATLLLPKEFPYISRKLFINSNLYMDTKSSYHTVIDFISYDKLIWDEANSKIVAKPVNTAATRTLANEIADILQELKTLTGSGLARDLYPDLRLAYLGRDNQSSNDVGELSKYFYTLDRLNLDDHPEFHDVEEVKEQILNADFWPLFCFTGSGTPDNITLKTNGSSVTPSSYLSAQTAMHWDNAIDVLTQDSSGYVLIYGQLREWTDTNATSKHPDNSWLHTKVINSYVDINDGDDIAVMTRLKNYCTTYDVQLASGYSHGETIITSGTEILMGFIMPYPDTTNPSSWGLEFLAGYMPYNGSTMQRRTRHMNVDYMPKTTYFYSTGPDTYAVTFELWIQEHIYALPALNEAQFDGLALQSLFLPALANFDKVGKSGSPKSSYRK